jgi:hypothetical protein
MVFKKSLEISRNNNNFTRKYIETQCSLSLAKGEHTVDNGRLMYQHVD